MRSRLLLVGAALLIWSAANPAVADARQRRVGIVVTVAVNLDDAEARKIAVAMGEALRLELPVDPVAGEETERRLPPEGLPENCVAEASCRNDLGRRLDADELLMLVLVRMGDTVQVDATWANVASGQVTARPRIDIGPGHDPQKVFAAEAERLLPHLVERDQPDEPKIVVVTQPGETTDDGRRMTAGSWIASSIGVAALIGGGIFALSAQNKFDALESDDCRTMPCPDSQIDSLERHALAADLLFGVAAVSAVTAVVLYVRSGGERPAVTAPAGTPPPVSVQVGEESVGLMLGGRF